MAAVFSNGRVFTAEEFTEEVKNNSSILEKLSLGDGMGSLPQNQEDLQVSEVFFVENIIEDNGTIRKSYSPCVRFGAASSPFYLSSILKVWNKYTGTYCDKVRKMLASSPDKLVESIIALGNLHVSTGKKSNSGIPNPYREGHEGYACTIDIKA